VRLPPNRLVLFEAVANAIHRAAPQAAIAFDTRPDDSGAAAAMDLRRFRDWPFEILKHPPALRWF
jgi:hypothetical protein